MTEIKEKKEIEVKTGKSTESNESIKETPKKQSKKNAIQLRKYHSSYWCFQPCSLSGTYWQTGILPIQIRRGFTD